MRLVEVIGHTLEHRDRVDVAHADPFRHLQDDRRVIEQRPHRARDEHIGGFLRRRRGHGDDPDLDLARGDDLGDPALGEDDQAARLGRLADFARVVIEDRRDLEIAFQEPAIARDRLPQVAEADQGDLPISGQVEDAADLAEEEGDVVALPLLAEPPEIGEIAPNLRRP